eukprot:scaffold94974_cov60-Phaeocystis_antarctica.AAC.4
MALRSRPVTCVPRVPPLTAPGRRGSRLLREAGRAARFPGLQGLQGDRWRRGAVLAAMLTLAQQLLEQLLGLGLWHLVHLLVVAGGGGHRLRLVSRRLSECGGGDLLQLQDRSAAAHFERVEDGAIERAQRHALPQLGELLEVESAAGAVEHAAAQGMAVFQLPAGEGEALLIGRDALFVLDLVLDVHDGIRTLDLERDGLAR